MAFRVQKLFVTSEKRAPVPLLKGLMTSICNQFGIVEVSDLFPCISGADQLMITAGPSMVPNMPVVPGMAPAQQYPPGYQMPPGYMWQDQINN